MIIQNQIHSHYCLYLNDAHGNAEHAQNRPKTFVRKNCSPTVCKTRKKEKLECIFGRILNDKIHW